MTNHCDCADQYTMYSKFLSSSIIPIYHHQISVQDIENR